MSRPSALSLDFALGTALREFDWYVDAHGFFVDNHVVLATVLALYVPVIFGIKAFMNHRQPFDLRFLLGLWNVFLAVFSGLGTYFCLPPLFHRFMTTDLQHAICDVDKLSWGHPEIWGVWWGFAFAVFKWFELADTVFIVLRKKPLIFLHWYHHVVTALFCWYGALYFTTWNSLPWCFAAMNLLVHTLLYTYYACDAFGFRQGWGQLLTVAQILQMVIGVALMIYSRQCPGFTNEFDFVFGFGMYLSYFVLFAKLYSGRWGKKKTVKPARD